jgi:hypothetical protein
MREAMRVADHLSLDQVKMQMQMRGGLFQLQKWLVIYNALIDPRPLSEIALHTGLAEGTVCRIIAEYNSYGPRSLESAERSGTVYETIGERLKACFQ